MAKSTGKSEGAQVRAAFDGPDIDYDTFIAHHSDQQRYEDSAQSKMGEARQKRGDFLEETNLNGKAVPAIRSGLKIKDDAKQFDWLRSMKVLIAIVDEHITGNTTPDMFDAAPSQESDGQAEQPEVDAVRDLEQFTPDAEGDVGAGDDGADLDAEAEDFKAAVEALAGNTVQAFN